MFRFSSLFVIGLLAGSIHALPTPDPDCNTQDVATEQSFSLVAKVTKSSLGIDVNNWVVTGVHSGAGQALQILTQADPLDYSKVGSYYQNGTKTGREPLSAGPNDDSVLVRGTGSLIYGLRLDENISPNGSNYIVSAEVGQGEPGVFVRYAPANDTTATRHYPFFAAMGDIHGQFYTCNTTLFSPQPVQALSWRSLNESTPADCAEIILVPQCFGALGNDTQYTDFVQDASCFRKAVDFELPKKY